LAARRVVKVAVKWGKNKYDVDLNLDEPPLIFKAQLFMLTQVPTERQKIMIPKVGVLKDDPNAFSKIDIRDGAVLTLIGSAEAVSAPAEKTVFA
jgi:ubiquitin carboxyl-terminal hydrolase 14